MSSGFGSIALMMMNRTPLRHPLSCLNSLARPWGFPHSPGVINSRWQHGQMRELRVQHQGRPYRVLYAFDPRRVAMLLIGGDKTGNDRWYEEMVPKADRIFDQHLREIG